MNSLYYPNTQVRSEIPVRDKNEKFLTTHIVAKRLGRSPKWVRHMIMCGELNAYNFSAGTKKARYGVPEAEVERFLNSRKLFEEGGI